jgi:hypothetical protein
MASGGSFVVTWESWNQDGSGYGIYAQRYAAENEMTIFAQQYDNQHRAIGVNFQLNASTEGYRLLPDVAIDSEGNLAFTWNDAHGVTSRWFDKWANMLADEVRVVGIQGGLLERATVTAAPNGEFIVAWPESGETGDTLVSQRYTLSPPTVTSVTVNSSHAQVVVGFFQEMATSGRGSVLNPHNWGLRLAGGRYVLQADATIVEGDPRATPEQLEDISFAFNEVTAQWEATLTFSSLAVGSYTLIARSSLENAAGRRMDGNADGIGADDSLSEFTVAGSGDFDNDGVVDGHDFLLWQRNLSIGSLDDWKRTFGSSIDASASLGGTGSNLTQADFVNENALREVALNSHKVHVATAFISSHSLQPVVDGPSTREQRIDRIFSAPTYRSRRDRLVALKVLGLPTHLILGMRTCLKR